MAEKLNLTISGMSCDGCVRRVRNLLERAGVEEIHSVEVGSAEVSINPQKAGAQAVASALEKAGFGVKANG